MKLQRLSLSNYRGFTQLDIEFGQKITVLAGVNGSGKSGILTALAALLSHLLRNEGVSKETPVSLSIADVHLRKTALTLSGAFQSGEHTSHAQITRSVPDSSKAPEYMRRRDAIRQTLRNVEKGSVKQLELEDDLRFLSALLDTGYDHFSYQIDPATLPFKRAKGVNPFAVLYTTSRYFRGAGTRASKVRAFDPAEASSGALKALPYPPQCADWFFAAQEGAIGTKANSKRLIEYLQAVVRTLLPGFSNLRIEPSPPRLFVRKGRGEFELAQLSDGERGLLALAFDLTRRLAIANPKLKDPVTKGEAIVLLDEVELHLHPTWQRAVLRRLTQTFKGCQFVVTTHSPQVIGQALPATLRLLHRESDGDIRLVPVTQSFGMDSNWVLQEIMDTPARDYATERKLASVNEAIDAGHLLKARRLVKKLGDELGPFPELQELKSMIDRLQMLKRR